MNRTPRITFVLVEPRHEGNIGACCRALKNNGFRSLRLVRPAAIGGDARALAWKSLDVLAAARHCASVHEAVADARLVAAFSARPRRDARAVLTLGQAVPRILQAERSGRVALLFGREDRGLTRAELVPASLLVNIPAAGARRVYNLSQAVLLAAFALRQAWIGTSAPAAGETQPEPARLTAAEHEYLRGRMRAALAALGYDEHADQGLLERIVGRAGRILDRAGIDASDNAMLLGVLKRVERLGGR
ncbi:MAG: hypothetical protein HY812_13145 [Planctomycetes bacterium]|nr:hypothetical protein [Planctomycetota bacterium]